MTRVQHLGRGLAALKLLLAPAGTAAAAVVTNSVESPAPWLVSIAIGALIVAYLGEIGNLFERPGKTDRAARRLLTYFANQVFAIPESHGQSVPDPTIAKPFRVTIMKPAWGWFRPRLRPYLRAEPGVEAYVPDTSIRFRKGDAIAGFAWEQPGSWARLDLRSLQDCGGDREKWKEAWTQGKVRDEIVRVIEQGRSRYMEYVRSIACLGIKVDGTILVVSIDSVFADVMKVPEPGQPNFFRTMDPNQLLAIANFLAKDIDNP